MEKSNLSIDELIELQKQYRAGKIKEEDLSDEQIDDLIVLYKREIEYLEKLIEKDKQKILKN